MINNVLNPTDKPDNIHIHLEENVEGEKTAQSWGASGFCSYWFFRKTDLSRSLGYRDSHRPLSLLMLTCERYMSPNSCQKNEENQGHRKDYSWVCSAFTETQPGSPHCVLLPWPGSQGVGSGRGHRKQEILQNGTGYLSVVWYWRWPKGEPFKYLHASYGKAEGYPFYNYFGMFGEKNSKGTGSHNSPSNRVEATEWNRWENHIY